MLARQRKPLGPDTLCAEHLSVLVKLLEGVVEHGHGLRSMTLPTSDVAEIDERADSGHSFGREVTDNRWDVHLQDVL